jgi:predicted aminopeptidase
VVALLALCATACACHTASYLARGGLAEARILWGREPIARVLARPDLTPELRERLQLVLDVRRFAGDVLGLRVGDTFSSFAEVEGDAIVWVVSAAHRDRLEPYTWWYPVVGRVPYQGYFERPDAAAAADVLDGRGYDVDVRPATAFSTLGWFADPLLSTTAKADPLHLAEIVIHELFHGTLYVPGATAFNESAATFVGHRGAIAYFCDGPGRDERRCARAREQWRQVRAHGRVLGRYVARLRALYARPSRQLAAERVALATVAAASLVRRGLGRASELVPPNNARLLAMTVYETHLDLFDRIGPTSAALPHAIARIVAAARGQEEPFEAVRRLVPEGLQSARARLDSPPP